MEQVDYPEIEIALGYHDASAKIVVCVAGSIMLAKGIAALGEGVELPYAAHNLFLRRWGERGEPVGEADNA
ncbi:hypothetical protein [Methylocystis sp.]|uniref:hypothetical protein n=1 Tax=Methylocystis sp. TaxID=1911079 RepID=UPI003DA5910D